MLRWLKIVVFNVTLKFRPGSASKSDANNCTEIGTSIENIAWWTEPGHKFQPTNLEDKRLKRLNPNLNYRSANHLLQDPNFVVPMGLTAFTSFSKLYTDICKDLIAGTNYTLIVDNVLQVNKFADTKQCFIIKTTSFGDSNEFLAIPSFNGLVCFR